DLDRAEPDGAASGTGKIRRRNLLRPDGLRAEPTAGGRRSRRPVL
ncbi:MAG: hypothetical protein AVDCRST_MAG19-4857, partial [uncultured Thermomicrobiales bacterium]